MQSPIHLKKNIEFNKSFRGLLDVLKNLAVAEYHILERKLKFFEELQEIASNFFSSIDLEMIRHPFVLPGPAPLAVVAVTSDAGLLGGLNMQVVSKAVDIVREKSGHLVVVGERGQVYAQESGLQFTSFPGVADAQRFRQAYEMRDFLSTNVLKGNFGGVKVVYPRALSFVNQRVEVSTLIPFSRESTEAAEPLKATDVIFESDPRDVVEYMVYLIMGQKLYEVYGMARVAEQAARFLHLEESCNKILEMNHKLLLQYFRRRHEVIDANMRELFSARSLYAK